MPPEMLPQCRTRSPRQRRPVELRPAVVLVAATVQTQWQTGYVIEPARVTNTGTATINGWTVTLTLPAGHTVTGSWNTVLTVNGQTVTARNASHNGTVAAGGNTAFGFQVQRPNGNTQVPSGYACTSPRL